MPTCKTCGTIMREVERDRYICPNYPKHPSLPDLPSLTKPPAQGGLAQPTSDSIPQKFYCVVCGSEMIHDSLYQYSCPKGCMADSPIKTFASGAWRDEADIPAYSLIPPCAIRRLANVYKVGEQHYPNRNWRKGIPVTNVIDHALEHLMKWISGNREEDHLAKVAWAMFTLAFYEEEGILDDDIKWNYKKDSGVR